MDVTIFVLDDKVEKVQETIYFDITIKTGQDLKENDIKLKTT